MAIRSSSIEYAYNTVQLKYSCPGCTTPFARELGWYDPAYLANRKMVFISSVLCSKCSARHEIRYQSKKNKNVKLVDFIFQGKSVLKKMKKTIELSSN